MLYIKLFIEREKNTGRSAPECPFNSQRIVVTAGEVAVCMSGEFGLAGDGAEHVEDWLECY